VPLLPHKPTMNVLDTTQLWSNLSVSKMEKDLIIDWQVISVNNIVDDPIKIEVSDELDALYPPEF